VGGRNGAGAAAIAAAAADAAPPFRFSRMGPKGVNRQLGEPNRKKVGNKMAAGGVSQIPAGFTYLGQFIDHDQGETRGVGVVTGGRSALSSSFWASGKAVTSRIGIGLMPTGCPRRFSVTAARAIACASPTWLTCRLRLSRRARL
jgi:hypothetical protein